jgi:hypothetical protein
MNHRGPRLFAVATALAVATSACGGGGVDDVPSSGGEPAVSTEATTATTRSPNPRNQGILTEDALDSIDVRTWIGQQRHLEGTRRITVPVQFLSDDPVTVTAIAVRTPHFDPLPPEPKASLLHPGRKVALQVDLGTPRCGPLVDDPSQVHLTVRLGDEVPRDLVLPVPTWLLDALRDRECEVGALTEAVSVRFGASDPPDGILLDTELVVERKDSIDRIEIERIAGSVLLTISPETGDTPVAALPPDASHVRIPVEVSATRCDAHGLAGSQKTFVFSVWISVDGAEPIYLEVRPPPEVESAMRATIDSCIRAGA